MFRIYICDNVNLMSVEDKHSIFMKEKFLWHSDSSFKPILSTYSIFAANEVPFSGGETEFADTRVCYYEWNGLFGDKNTRFRKFNL